MRTSARRPWSRRRKRRATKRREPAPAGSDVLVAFGLGGNQGPVAETLRRAVAGLSAALGRLTVAPLYRTAAVLPPGAPPQPDFLNSAVLAATPLPPPALLALAKALERAAGRRAAHLAPRPLDVDLLLYGAAVSATPELVLPHPRLRVRRFVLEPLAAIAPELPVPPDGATVAELLARLARSERVERIGSWVDGGWRLA